MALLRCLLHRFCHFPHTTGCHYQSIGREIVTTEKVLFPVHLFCLGKRLDVRNDFRRKDRHVCSLCY